MESVFYDFISALRHSGVRISVAENMDALNAARIVGYSDRGILKQSLSSALAKSLRELELFESCFERFFSADFFSKSEIQNENLVDEKQIGRAHV